MMIEVTLEVDIRRLSGHLPEPVARGHHGDHQHEAHHEADEHSQAGGDTGASNTHNTLVIVIHRACHPVIRSIGHSETQSQTNAEKRQCINCVDYIKDHSDSFHCYLFRL